MVEWEKVYQKWRAFQQLDPDLKRHLTEMESDRQALEDAFYTELTFGTGGMRGILGPGINRMNVYTVRKAVHGLANYLLHTKSDAKERGVVIAYDSRHMSREFAVESAKVLGSSGIRTYVFDTLRPTPLLSYAVRYLDTAAGIMITASHNPPEYNGFKVYNEVGGQITPEEADKIIASIQEVENELAVPFKEADELEKEELLIWLKKEVDQAYLQQLKGISKIDEQMQTEEKNLQIVFTPLHGTALYLVAQGLEQLGFSHVEVVKEQAKPDPEFSTVSSPNPEEHQAFTLAIEEGKQMGADILLGTDPDADRLGVAVKNEDGEYQVLTGNQLGALLLDYILSHSDAQSLKDGRMLKTVVTSELGQAIADHYDIKTINTLTGFKYIADKIRQFEATGERFLFGYEESYGYLIDAFTRDKDAVQAAVMAAEMAYYWKKKGKTLLDALNILFDKHGYYLEGLSSLKMEGKAGSEKINKIMSEIRRRPQKEIAGMAVKAVEDYASRERTFYGEQDKMETIELPKENMVKFLLESGGWVCLRPSGTEPKIKYYYGVCGKTAKESEEKLQSLKVAMDEMVQEIISQGDTE
ncbi:phospho-sugar mutase [Virgibacillus kimchii]